MSRYLLADTIVFIWTFFGIRMFMYSIIAHLYNTSSRKNFEKGKTLWNGLRSHGLNKGYPKEFI